MADPSAFVLLRHAEPESVGTDPALNANGKRRAKLLASMFRDAGVTAIFTSDLRRTKETAAPLATNLHLVPEELPGLDAATNRDRVRAVSGGLVVVVGHTNTVPALIAALGVTIPVTIGPNEFDRLFLISPVNGKVAFLALHYGG